MIKLVKKRFCSQDLKGLRSLGRIPDAKLTNAQDARTKRNSRTGLLYLRQGELGLKRRHSQTTAQDCNVGPRLQLHRRPSCPR